MISAGESSGELYGALLSREIKNKWSDAEITGIGGLRMKNEGVNVIAPITSAIGLTETIRQWKEIINSFKKAKEFLIRQKPDILVLIDYPDFNIALGKKAKKEGIPILYYVSPQVWAWRAGRAKKIASLVNNIAVLFPFEVDIYRNTGLACEFVGHPIAELIDIHQTKEELKEKLGIAPHKKVIALLPGSRPSEIIRHQNLIKEVAEKIHNEFPDMQIVIPLVSGTHIEGDIPDYIKVIYDCTTEVIACSESAAVASGTVTLETALLGIPMVVFYKLSPLTFFLGKLLIRVKFISLVNILAAEEVVTELIQGNATAKNIFSELKRILTIDEYRYNMISKLQKVKELMGRKTASAHVASMVGKLAGWNNTSD